MSDSTSHRQILRSSSIIGGASVINILVSLLRVKVAAVLLGPAGIGLIGLLQNLMASASAVAAMGFGTVGTRQIAEAAASEDVEKLASARRALRWGTLVLAVVGMCCVWALRAPLSNFVLGDATRAPEVGWLALGVALTVAAGSQSAILAGLRRIGDIARITVLSGIVATLVGIGALWLWGSLGLMVFVLAPPLAAFLLGHVYVARLPKLLTPKTPNREMILQWRTMARLGAAFMVSGVVGTLGQLAVRSMVQHQLGAEALGQFQSAWMISMTYIGFVLGAMGTDYYPRLTAAIRDPLAVNRMVNEQTEVALLLAGPVLLAMLMLAPWVIQLLYSSQFDQAAGLLRWQILGDVLKIASFPLGFILLAAGAGRTFMVTESLAMGVFSGLVWLWLPVIGLNATALGFVGMYVINLPLMYWLARRRTGFAWTARVRIHFFALALTALGVCLLLHWSMWAGASVAVVGILCFMVYGLIRLGELVTLIRPLRRIATSCRAAAVEIQRSLGLGK